MHSLSEVLFCQPDMPSLGLAVTFDNEQLFWFDAPLSRWQPRLPDFPAWPEATEPPSELVHDTTLCQNMLESLTAFTSKYLPMAEAKGRCPLSPPATPVLVPPLPVPPVLVPPLPVPPPVPQASRWPTSF